jgi:hypothetical protein
MRPASCVFKTPGFNHPRPVSSLLDFVVPGYTFVYFLFFGDTERHKAQTTEVPLVLTQCMQNVTPSKNEGCLFSISSRVSLNLCTMTTLGPQFGLC